jgi:hypothetical protein
MKRFSTIKETEDPDSKLRLCFEFEADEDPTDDLYAVGLLFSSSTVVLRSGKEQNYNGHAYVLHEGREGLEKAQEQLRQMGWEEIPNM